MNETQLQLWKEITDNIALIIGTLSGGVIAIVVGAIQARTQLKQTKIANTISLQKEAIKDYFEALYNLLRSQKEKPENDTNFLENHLLIKQSSLLPLFEPQQKELLLDLTENAISKTATEETINAVLKSLKY